MNRLKRLDWRIILAVLVVCVVVPLASIAIVRSHNRNRAMTRAITDALAQLEEIPDSVVSRVVPTQNWRFKILQTGERIASGDMPADSTRAFYHEYAAVARDGILSVHDVHVMARIFGLITVSKETEGDVDSVNMDSM